MLKAFARFVREVEAEYPHAFEHQDFAPIVTMFRALSRDSSSAGIRLCDMATCMAGESSPLIERLYFLDRLVKDLKDLKTAEAVLAQRVDYARRPH